MAHDTKFATMVGHVVLNALDAHGLDMTDLASESFGRLSDEIDRVEAAARSLRSATRRYSDAVRAIQALPDDAYMTDVHAVLDRYLVEETDV